MEWESYDEEEWDRGTQKQDMNWEECGRTLIKESSECGAQVHAGLEMLKEYWERRNEHLKAGGQGEIATVRREAIHQEYGNGEGLTRMMLFDESEKEAMQFSKEDFAAKVGDKINEDRDRYQASRKSTFTAGQVSELMTAASKALDDTGEVLVDVMGAAAHRGLMNRHEQMSKGLIESKGE